MQIEVAYESFLHRCHWWWRALIENPFDKYTDLHWCSSKSRSDGRYTLLNSPVFVRDSKSGFWKLMIFPKWELYKNNLLFDHDSKFGFYKLMKFPHWELYKNYLVFARSLERSSSDGFQNGKTRLMPPHPSLCGGSTCGKFQLSLI